MTRTRNGRRSRRAAALATLVGLVIALTACGADADGATRITFAVGSPTLTESTAPYSAVPQELGYWSSQGLDVDVQPTAGATASIQLLVAGQADIVNGGTSALYQAAATNRDIRVISLDIANVWHVVVPKDSGITSLTQLRGTTIGAQSLSSASYQFGRAALAAAGVDPDKDVQWLPVGVGSQAAQAFKSREISAYATYAGPSGTVGNALGTELVDLPSAVDKQRGMAGLATTRQYMEEQPAALHRFLVGYYQGAIFAAANPGAALQLQWRAVPPQKPRGIPVNDAVAKMLPVVQGRFRTGADPGVDGVVGAPSLAEQRSTAAFLLKYKIMTRAVDPGTFTDLRPTIEANRSIDAAAIRRQATEWVS